MKVDKLFMKSSKVLYVELEWCIGTNDLLIFSLFAIKRFCYLIAAFFLPNHEWSPTVQVVTHLHVAI